MIEIKNLYKNYGRLEVLKNINLQIENGKIYGLLGRNGVGKTTLLKILSNQISNFQGEILMDGKNIYEQQEQVEEIVFIQESFFDQILMKDEKISQIFRMASLLLKEWDHNFQVYLVKQFGIDPNQEYSKLSKGNQTIVGLIIGLCARTKVVIFDEPNIGLDANNRYLFYRLLMEDLELHPRTVIIATHVIDELENILEEVIILKNKKVLLQGSIEKLKDKGLLLTGRKEVLSALENRNIIYKETMGSIVVMGVYDKISREEKQKLRNNGVEISSISLQKLLVYLTN